MDKLKARAEANRARQFEDPVSWIQNNFWIPELRGPIQLHPYQQAVLREAYRRDEDGKLVYSIVVWSDIKKSAKSCIAAAVALHRGYLTPWGSIKIVANDLKQANSRVNYYMRRAIDLNPEMRDKIQKVFSETRLPNRCVVEAIPVDPKGEAGGNDDLIIFSELWAANQRAALRMWTEMTLSPTKFGHSQRWVETYAGYEGESPTLENLYEQGVKDGIHLDLSYVDEDGSEIDLEDLEVFANPEIGLLCLWNTRPRLPWQTAEYYASEEGLLTPDDFARVHRNQWVSSTQKFVKDEWWDDCKGEYPEFNSSDLMNLAADAGLTDDTFALVGTTLKNGLTYVRYVGMWEAPPGGKIDYYGTAEEPGPEREIVRLALTYRINELRYDEYQLHDMGSRLRAGIWVSKDGEPLGDVLVDAVRNSAQNASEQSETTTDFLRAQRGLSPRNLRQVKIPTRPFSQGVERLKSDKQLYDRIRQRTLVHSGEDNLMQHIQNSNRKNEGEKGIRIVKRAQKKKIDLAVALSMAAFGEENELPPPTDALRPLSFTKTASFDHLSNPPSDIEDLL